MSISERHEAESAVVYPSLYLVPASLVLGLWPQNEGIVIVPQNQKNYFGAFWGVHLGFFRNFRRC
jgi:hypothetical protein